MNLTISEIIASPYMAQTNGTATVLTLDETAITTGTITVLTGSTGTPTGTSWANKFCDDGLPLIVIIISILVIIKTQTRR